jgi:tetratricopeptide (TPR) repeat protein
VLLQSYLFSTMTESPEPLPSLPEAYQALARGHASAVLAWAERAEQTGLPALPWTALRAVALSFLQRPLEALPHYQWLCAHEPNHAAHWSNLGNCLCELAREREALEPLQKALLLGATDPALHFGLARAYASSEQLELARRHIETAIARAPDDVEFELLQLRILQALDRWPEANALSAQLQLRGLSEGQQIDLGYLLFRGQHYPQAIAAFSQSVGDPDLALDAKIGLVMAYERTNRMQEATALQAEISEPQVCHNPKLLDNFWQMQAKLAMRGKQYPQARRYFEQILQSPHQDGSLQLGLLMDYAAALDKCREPQLAMQALQQAHAMRRAAVSKIHPALQDNTEAFAVLDDSAMPAWNPALHRAGHAVDPVFVVGFPRSGTTLLEQLLDAHPALQSFDEQPFLQHMARRLLADHDTLHAAITGLSPERWQAERAHYFAEVQAIMPAAQQRRPVDKNPLNMVRLPLLQNLFPKSQVILAIRHPCDVVLSCYQQNFRAPAFALAFESLASTAQMYDKVFSHWMNCAADLQLPVLHWKYEDLVADTEGRARVLFEFLDLPWQDDILAFTERAKAKGVIKTPSYTQVVEPVNARAIGRWQAYAPYYTPDVMRHLTPWIERFGY